MAISERVPDNQVNREGIQGIGPIVGPVVRPPMFEQTILVVFEGTTGSAGNYQIRPEHLEETLDALEPHGTVTWSDLSELGSQS